MYENRFNKPMAPVKEGEELDVKIEALGEKGDGIAKKNGFVLVIPGTQVNDEVRVKVTRVLRKVGFAEVVGKAQSTPKTDAESEGSEESDDAESEETEETEEAEEVEEAEDSEDFGEEKEQ